MDGCSHLGIAEREGIMVRWKCHEGLVPTDLKHAEDGSRRSGTDRCLAYMQALGLSELTKSAAQAPSFRHGVKPRIAVRRKLSASGIMPNSYFVSTVGGAPLAIVEQYIESQKGV